MKYNERIYQSNNFKFDEFNGLKLEKLIAVEKPETASICLVYIKVKNHIWHSFFLDYGFGVWENWSEENIEEDDSYNYINKTIEFKLLDKEILQIWCESLVNHCQIVINFVDGTKVILKTLDVNDFESKSELVLRQNEIDSK